MITNKPNVSEAWVQCAENDAYDKVGDYSATELVSPVQLQILMSRHREEIVQDISEMVWLILGSATHYILDRAHMKGVITEERFLVPINGCHISMKPDRAEPIEGKSGEYRLIDFKTVSRFTIANGPKPDWVKQMNIYAHGLRTRGFKVTEAKVECLIKDWSHTDCHVKKVHGYPPFPLMSLAIELWDDDRVLSYVKSRVKEFEDAQALPDHLLPECTAAERWASPDSYAVVYLDGKGKGSAVRGGAKLKTRGEANAVLGKQKRNCAIEFRRSASTRCERYCSVNKWCNQYKSMHRVDPF